MSDAADIAAAMAQRAIQYRNDLAAIFVSAVIEAWCGSPRCNAVDARLGRCELQSHDPTQRHKNGMYEW